MTIKIIIMILDIYSFYIANRRVFCYNLNKETFPGHDRLLLQPHTYLACVSGAFITIIHHVTKAAALRRYRGGRDRSIFLTETEEKQ